MMSVDDSKSDSVGKSVYSQPPAKKGPDVRVGVESPQVKTTKKQQLASNMAAKDEPTSGQRETENLKDLKAAVEVNVFRHYYSVLCLPVLMFWQISK